MTSPSSSRLIPTLCVPAACLALALASSSAPAGDPELLEPSPAAASVEPAPAPKAKPKQKLKPSPTASLQAKAKSKGRMKPKPSTAPSAAAGPSEDRSSDERDEPPGPPPSPRADPTIGRIVLAGKLPAWVERVGLLAVSVDGTAAGHARVTDGAIDWRSGPLSAGSHTVSVKRAVGNVLTTFDKVQIAAGQDTRLSLADLPAPTGTLILELEYTGDPANKLASSFDVSIDGAAVAQKGTLSSSSETGGTSRRTFRFETRLPPGTHQVAATLCDPGRICGTKRFHTVKIALGLTTTVLHRWKGRSLTSMHAGVRSFDAPCDCDEKTWTPAGR